MDYVHASQTITKVCVCVCVCVCEGGINYSVLTFSARDTFFPFSLVPLLDFGTLVSMSLSLSLISCI